MHREQVGTVSSLWRYPVKSMLGEQIKSSQINNYGLLGDRAYALLDTQTGKIASAKNPRKWAKLLEFHASLGKLSDENDVVPPATISLPDGTFITSDSPEIDAVLSSVLNQEVNLLSSAPDTASLEQYWPPVEGTAHQDKVTELEMPSGTFFDSCFIHLIATATLARLQELYPEGAFSVQRFRPNVVIETPTNEMAFAEDDWVGGVLAIGETVRLSIDTACPRCVVTTLAQGDLPQDLNILRTTARHNNVVAGIRTSVIQEGIIHQNDPIWLEKSV